MSWKKAPELSRPSSQLLPVPWPLFYFNEAYTLLIIPSRMSTHHLKRRPETRRPQLHTLWTNNALALRTYVHGGSVVLTAGALELRKNAARGFQMAQADTKDATQGLSDIFHRPR
jgi:hypothetical protein